MRLFSYKVDVNHIWEYHLRPHLLWNCLLENSPLSSIYCQFSLARLEYCFPPLPYFVSSPSQGCLPGLREPGHVAIGTSPAIELPLWHGLCIVDMMGLPSIRTQVCRFACDDSVSYTDRSKKEILAGSSFHSSDQDIWRSGEFHFVHAPCFTQTCSSSSVPLLTKPYLFAMCLIPFFELW